MTKDLTASDNASRRAVARNVSVSYLYLLVVSVTSFMATPVILDGLRVTDFGILSLALSVVGYSALLDLGIGTVTVRRLAAASESPDRDRINRILATSRRCYLVVSVIGCAYCGVAAVLAPVLFDLPADRRATLSLLILLLGLCQNTLLPLGVYNELIIGMGRTDRVVWRTMALGLLVPVMQVSLVTWTSWGVWSVAAPAALGSVLAPLVTVRMARRVHPGLVARARRGDWLLARSMAREGSQLSAMSVAGMLSVGSDLVIVGAILPLSAVAGYAVAAKMAGVARLLVTRMADVLLPVYAHGHALQGSARQLRLVASSTTATLALAVPVAIGLLATGPLLLDLWLRDVPQGAAEVLTVLAVALLLQMPGQVCTVYLIGANMLGRLLPVSIVAAVVNLTLSVVLAHRVGVAGPAMSTLIVAAVVDLVVVPRIACDTLQVRLWAYYRTSVVLLTGPAAIASGVALIAMSSAPGLAVALTWTLMPLAYVLSLLAVLLLTGRTSELQQALSSVASVVLRNRSGPKR